MSRPWWHDAVTYEIYVRSFCDSDGDGVGDLPGIRSKLPHLAALGVDAVWLTPFYRSPMADHGYDVADYCDVDPLFGTIADADALIADAHALGLRVVVDVVPNHTSDQHPWFQQALADPTSPARRRYHFRDPAPDGGPPNNWTSVFGGPAWTLDPASGQYYLHLFAPEQPDLNWAEQEVHDELDRVLRFWLDRGVDGFRIDVAHGLYKHPTLESTPQPEAESGIVEGTDYSASLVSRHLWDREEVHDVYRRWRRIVDSYPGDRAMVGEVFLYDIERIARYARPDELHLSFNFLLMGQSFDAAHWRRVVELSLAGFRAVSAPTQTWVLANHDVTRAVTRYGGGATGRRRWRAALLAMLALPGAPYLYQGEELGLDEVVVPEEARQDPIWERSGRTVVGRDGCRAPLPWTADEPGLGFTSGDPWLPFGPEYAAQAAALQEADPASHLSFTRAALALRRELLADGTLPGNEIAWEGGVPEGVLAFRRAGLRCLLNTGDRPVSLPGTGRLLLASDPSVVVTASSVELPAATSAWVAT